MVVLPHGSTSTWWYFHMVVLPYVQGLSETTSRIMKNYKVNTAMKPHNTIKRSLVRPKDKVEPQKMCEGVYSITCKNCNATYIGETKRTLGTHIKEHKEDAEKASACRPYSRSNRKTPEKEMHKSAITDHITQQNHIVDWEGANKYYSFLLSMLTPLAHLTDLS